MPLYTFRNQKYVKLKFHNYFEEKEITFKTTEEQ